MRTHVDIQSQGASKTPSRYVRQDVGLVLGLLGLLFLVFAMAGCDDDDHKGFSDTNPPAIPAGVHSITGDNVVYLRWLPNREADLVGYDVFRDDDVDDGIEEFFLLEEISHDDYYLADIDLVEYVDDDLGDFLQNGKTYSYAVRAVDSRGNVSDVSFELVEDTPRPEQLDPGLRLFESGVDATRSGYDFSGLTNQVQAMAAASTDVYLTRDGGILYFAANADRVQIQDYGNVGFDTATIAPLDGWSLAGRAEAILNHTYILKIYDGAGRTGAVHYAKITVVDLGADNALIWWGYQVDPGNPQLKVPGKGSDTRIKEEVTP